MRLTFYYAPVTDLAAATAYYRDQLGFDEAWREGDDTVSFWMPGRVGQVMLSLTEQPPGPMYLVDDLAEWLASHPGVDLISPPYAIPGGRVAGVRGPESNAYYVFDQPDA
ncbi:hypothetical protein D9V37_01765 [Nocardioides mangrovicus]|uniref:VOC domain-containing protein n=1 Tax=Nocardioides mangrovicus TaxID=2478913 RepID=A0A3L8P6V3_9ACTN|nr:VOC family protein [Nocardioides mangrovicus]RLV50717.1 hypothetical protein D9V37_01765 [Nocardioides mangrovicus]